MNQYSMRLVLLIGLASMLASQAKAGAINDPVISLVGASPSQQTVKISVSISGAPGGTILNYTTDGSNPSMSSPTITSGGTLLVAQNANLQVEAFQNATTTSNIVSEKLTVAGQVSAGTAHTLILKNDGTVWSSGDNSAGELGNGSNTNASTPVQVQVNATSNLTGVVAIAAGNNESFAVDTNGKVWAWGLNTNSQLGLGTSSNTLYATQVTANGVSNIVGIAASQHHTLALRADGTVWSWGSDTAGESGNGTTAAWVTTPIEVLAPSGQSGNLSGIVAVAAGASHSLALTSGGNVYSFGSDAAGQLANNDASLTSQSRPVQVVSGGTALANVVTVAAGTSNSYFLKGDGTAFSAGDNTVGELGQGTVSATPVAANLSAAQVQDLPETLAAISNQSGFGSDGTLFTWGDNSTGKLAVGVSGFYATLPLAVNLGTQTPPTLTVASGNGQTVNDGSFSAPFTITATSGGSPLANTWVNLIVNPANGALGLSSGSSLLSPIIGGYTNSSGQISFYLDAPSNGSGSVSLTAASGATQSGLTAIEQMAQTIASSGEPTMPQALLVVLGASILFFGMRRNWHMIG